MSQLNASDLVEFSARVRQYKSLPKEGRMLHFSFIASQRCNDVEVNALFEKACGGEANREENKQFMDHLDQVKQLFFR